MRRSVSPEEGVESRTLVQRLSEWRQELLRRYMPNARGRESVDLQALSSEVCELTDGMSRFGVLARTNEPHVCDVRRRLNERTTQLMDLVHSIARREALGRAGYEPSADVARRQSNEPDVGAAVNDAIVPWGGDLP